MTAINTLRANAQANTQSLATVVDLSIRHLLAKALKDSGKFDNVATKMDSRRGSLSVKVTGTRLARTADNVVAIAKREGLTVQVRLTSSGWNETTFKVEQLVQTTTKSNTAPTQANLASSLAQAAPTYNGGNVAVYVAGVSLGYVSNEAAAKIRAIVTEDQRPKTQTVVLVNLVKNAPENVVLPFAVAEAVKNKVPSYAGFDYTVKSASGVVIVRNTKTGGHYVAC